MSDLETDIKLLLSLAVAFVMTTAIIVAVLEVRWLRRQGRFTRGDRRRMWLSLSTLPPNAVVSLATAPVWTAIYITAAQFAVFEIPINPFTIFVAFLVADFSYYWEHRCSHRIPILWYLYHSIHHSADSYTVSTAYRISFLTQLWAPGFYVPWILLGMDPVLIGGFQLFAFHYQAWIHTDMIGRLGFWDRWFNTPANHRMHHSIAHRDVNMGAVLIIWDKLFATYAPPESNVVYGIPGERAPQTPLALYTQTWRHLVPKSALSLFGHDGFASRDVNSRSRNHCTTQPNPTAGDFSKEPVTE